MCLCGVCTTSSRLCVFSLGAPTPPPVTLNWIIGGEWMDEWMDGSVSLLLQ